MYRSSSIDPPRIYLPPRRFLRLTGCIGRGIEPRRMAFVARLGLSLSRTRWSLLHHTPNAHVHCPSSQQGSSIPIGRKPSQPPRPSGLLYIVAHLYSSRRGTGTGRTLPPERRTTSLSLSPFHLIHHVCLPLVYTLLSYFCPCAFPSLHMHILSSPSSSVHTPHHPSFLRSDSALLPRRSSYSVPFPARGTGRVSVESDVER